MIKSERHLMNFSDIHIEDNNNVKYGLIMGIVYGIIGLIIGVCWFPQYSYPRQTFMRGWLVGFVIRTVLVVVAICVVVIYFCIMR